uniref:Reverse transcriptase domain-containing protein n=1 Tax=Podarcis muralis TaxID=64176 RepID=A0A670IZE6_PODMU
MALKIWSWNINGMNDKKKRNKIEHILKKESLDIICLQETHIARKHKRILINKRLGNEFVSSDKRKKRGVIIYIRKQLEAQQIYKDEEGRIVAVQLKWQGENVIIVGIYAPNNNKAEFYRMLEEKLSEYADQKIILLGDMNGVVSLNIDRLREGEGSEGKLPQTFFSLVNNLNLVDVWRFKFPLEKQYTFHSEPHDSFSRLDQIWVSAELVPRATKVEILPKTISDHNAVKLELKGLEERLYRWKMKDYLLDDQEIIEKAKRKLKEYFEDNQGKGTKMKVVWDAGKAVMRGFFIQQSAIKNKKREKGKKEILQQIRDNEQKLAENPKNKRIKENIKILQSQLALMINREIEWKVKKLRQKTFEHANKSGKILAWQLKKRKEQNTINKIVVEGEVKSNPKEIRKAFLDFYKDLYKNNENNNLRKIEEYLKGKSIQKITLQEKGKLSAPIEIDEIKDIIKDLKKGKAPGPDGYTGRYYKEMESILLTPMQEVMNNILRERELPETWKEALITLIPKQDSDLLQTKNYRPISLLNIDYKIFAGILAKRLKSILRESIHRDQAGFLPGRYMKDNIRNVVNIIEYLSDRCDKQGMLLFVDAEKAFDNLIWDFLLKQLEYMEVGAEFYNGVKAIYTEQKAKLIINGVETPEIRIAKGTRQGCPLSPLLFIMVLETLLNSIRGNRGIRGITVGQNEYKTKAFADDLVITMEDPLNSTKEVLEEFEQFGKVAGFKLNKKKTKIIAKNMETDKIEELQNATGIEVTGKVKYLGIWVTPKNIDLFKNNYDTVWKGVKKDIESWGRLKTSFWGRIAIIKMSVLPKMLFLFQNIPIIRGTKIFKEWQKVISKFIWQGKKPRIQYKLLTDVKERGGFALPDLKLYFEAACLCWIRTWIKLEDREVLDLEGFNIRFGWHAYLGYGKRKVHRGFGNHIFRGPLIEVWERNREVLEPKTPHWLSPLEAMSVSKKNRGDNWPTYEQLLIKEEGKWKLKPYDQIKEKVHDWLHYFQLNGMLRKDITDKGYADKDSRFQNEILNNNYRILSKMYNLLLGWNLIDEEVKSVAIHWARDIGHNIYAEEWEKLWKIHLKFTACVTLKENLMKMFYRWYLTPVKLAKMYGICNKCWKCREREGSFYHMWWECQKVKEFWEGVYNELKKILRYTFVKKPEAFLLGMIGREIRKKDHRFFQYATSAARILIAQNWKSENLPTIEEWRAKLLDYAEMDKMTGKIRYSKDQRFIEEWENFTNYLEKLSEGQITLVGFKRAL